MFEASWREDATKALLKVYRKYELKLPKIHFFEALSAGTDSILSHDFALVQSEEARQSQIEELSAAAEKELEAVQKQADSEVARAKQETVQAFEVVIQTPNLSVSLSVKPSVHVSRCSCQSVRSFTRCVM